MGRLRSRLQDMRTVCSQLRDHAESDARTLRAAHAEELQNTEPEEAELESGETLDQRLMKLEEPLDQLDVMMAERDFATAVETVQRLQGHVNSKKTVMSADEKHIAKMQVDKRLSLLTRSLTKELSNHCLRRSECK